MRALKNRVKKMFIRSIISGLFCFVCSSVPYTVYGADYNAAQLKKLFTDKNQRTQIDAARSGKSSAAGIKKTSKVDVSGYVIRSGGKSVVWMNDNNTLESSKIGGVRVHPASVGKNKKVTVSVGNKTRRLKPGETWSESTDKIKDNY